MNIGIRPSANSIKVKPVVRLETTVCFRITRWMNNEIKSQEKSYFPKRRESDDQNAVAIVKTVSQLGCVSQDSDALVSQGRKSRGNPTQKVLEPTQRVRFTKSRLRQASIREKKGPSLGKIQVKSPHQRSHHAMKFEDPSHEETERQQRCARSKAWNLAKKHFQAQRERQSYILLACNEVGNAGYVNKRTGGKRVCGRFRSECAYGQQTRPQLCCVGDHEDIKKSDDGDDGQRRGANKRRSDCICQRIGLIRYGYAS